MNPQTLKSNLELLEYLKKMTKILRENDYAELAKEVERASLFASGSSSEFLHETQIALEDVIAAKPKPIDPKEVQSVIHQIAEAFHRVGGA